MTRDVYYLDCHKHCQWINGHFTLNTDKLQNFTILKTAYVQTLTKRVAEKGRMQLNGIYIFSIAFEISSVLLEIHQ